MLRVTGHIEIEKDKAIRIRLNHDFCKYYMWLINKRYYGITGAGTFVAEYFNTPRYSSHISVILKQFHPWGEDWNNLNIKGKNVDIYYNVEDLRLGGGVKKGVWGFWMPIYCEFAENLKKELKVKDNNRYLGLHVSICNNKNLVK